MNNMKMTENEVLYAIENNEFSDNILKSSNYVIIAMTQDWCPQWLIMKRWLKKYNNESSKVYEIIYNKENYYNKFMTFKETVFKNNLVPYIRIYKNGKFIKDSNFRSEKMFDNIFENK